MGSKRVTLRSKQRVPVSPEIVIMLGANVTAAFYYTQLQYYDQYNTKDVDGWFHRNSKEIESDIGLNRRQQEHSRKILESKGWIETQSIRGGLRPTVKFRLLINYQKP